MYPESDATVEVKPLRNCTDAMLLIAYSGTDKNYKVFIQRDSDGGEQKMIFSEDEWKRLLENIEVITQILKDVTPTPKRTREETEEERVDCRWVQFYTWEMTQSNARSKCQMPSRKTIQADADPPGYARLDPS